MPSFQDPVRVKEAKVSTTTNNLSLNSSMNKPNYSINNITSSSSDTSYLNHSMSFRDFKEDNYDTCDDPLPILAVKSSPIIRKAKNIRTDAQNESTRDESDKEIIYKTPDQHETVPESPKLIEENLNTITFNSEAQPQIPTNVDCSKSFTSENIDHIPMFVQSLEYNIVNESSAPKIIELSDVPQSTIDTNHERSDEVSTKSDVEEKPRTFIQDKPSPSQYIVAPTPKRPADIENFFKQQSTSSPSNIKSLKENALIPSNNGTSKWAFGPHKNVTVIQVTLRKKSELGFTICEKQGYVSIWFVC